MGKLKELIWGVRTADPDPGASGTEIPEKSPDMLESSSTEGAEILRMRCFPVERIMGLFGVQEDTTSQDKIWRPARMEFMPNFLSRFFEFTICFLMNTNRHRERDERT